MGVDLLRDELVRVKTTAPAEPLDELVEYAETAAQAGAPPPEVGTSEKVTGACEVCGAREAVARCAQCERRACTEDLWVMYGLCRSCLPEEQLRRGRAPERVRRPDLGIKWINDE